MDEEKLSALGKFLRDTGHTQSSIAAQLGVSKAYVNALLNGKKAFGKGQAKKWGDLYGLSPSWLLTGEGAMIKDAPVATPTAISNNQRLARIYEALEKSNKVRNQSHFASLVGEKSRGNLSNYLSGSKPLGDDLVKRYVVSLSEAMPELSLDWLSTGEGDMVRALPAPAHVEEVNPGASLPDIGRRTDVWVGKDDRVYWTEAIQVGDEEDYQRATQEGVKLIPEFAEAFRGGTVGEAEELRTVDTYWGLPDVDGNMVVPIRGDSMAPRYPAGCRVVLKPYPFNPRRPLLLPFGEVFAVAVRQEDGYPPTHYLKKLHRHPDKAKENDYYIARSFNKEYEDFEIPINDICFLSAVVAKIDLEHTFTF
jgi:transcriptional regulator with XRE-family HTH domain